MASFLNLSSSGEKMDEELIQRIETIEKQLVTALSMSIDTQKLVHRLVEVMKKEISVAQAQGERIQELGREIVDLERKLRVDES